MRNIIVVTDEEFGLTKRAGVGGAIFVGKTGEGKTLLISTLLLAQEADATRKDDNVTGTL